MATELIKKSEILFEAVSKGSIEDLQKLLKKTKRQERAKIADAFNSKGETPLLVAIQCFHSDETDILVGVAGLP